MIFFRIISQPKPIGEEMYGCVVLVKPDSQEPRLLFQTFPVDIATAICGEDVWHHQKGRDLALCLENKRLLVKAFTRPSPLSEKEISDYLEFISRDMGKGQLDVKSALGITLEEEVRRLRFSGGQDEQVPEAKVG